MHGTHVFLNVRVLIPWPCLTTTCLMCCMLSVNNVLAVLLKYIHLFNLSDAENKHLGGATLPLLFYIPTRCIKFEFEKGSRDHNKK